jgi:hypothetical protein
MVLKPDSLENPIRQYHEAWQAFKPAQLHNRLVESFAMALKVDTDQYRQEPLHLTFTLKLHSEF